MNYKENYRREVKKEGIVEKKGNFDYISWANCEKIANELDQEFNWVAIATESGSLNHEGMVLIEMQFKGKTRRHYYPILNHQNKPISNPTQFDINNAQMRGMSKLFSMMSGIGLSLFTGEDLEIYEENKEEDKKKKFKELYKKHKFTDDELTYLLDGKKLDSLTEEEDVQLLLRVDNVLKVREDGKN